MIFTHDKKRFISLAYYDRQGVKRSILQMHRALKDGTFRLIYQSGAYLIVTPEMVWVTEYSQFTVKSNTDWSIE